MRGRAPRVRRCYDRRFAAGEPLMEAADPVLVDYLGRVADLAPLMRALAEETERTRRLPPPLLDGLLAAGLFRMLVPRPYGGAEMAPLTFIAVVEAIARIDASTAWCICQTGVCAMSAAYLPPEHATAIWGKDPRAVLAWGAASPQSRARAVPGGYRVTASWPFASGGHHATWMGGHCVIDEADGTPRRTADGKSVVRTLIFPASVVRWTEVWDVIGLCGTGSDTYAVEDLFVSDDFAIARDLPPRYEGPLYLMTTEHLLYGCGFASVALGVARAMLDAYVELAVEKTPRGLKSTLRDSPASQMELAELEARWRAARAYVRGTLGTAWRFVRANGTLDIENRVALRLAATHAIREARQVAVDTYAAAGATAIFASGPFERRLRDINAVAQQIQGRRQHYEIVGKHLLGLGADTTFL
jgi:indole-3-acetate monooxygenase